MNSLIGIVPPNPNPYMKKPANRTAVSPVHAAAAMSATPALDVENADKTSRRVSKRCKPYPQTILDDRLPAPFTASADAATVRAKPDSVTKGMAWTRTAVSAA